MLASAVACGSGGTASLSSLSITPDSSQLAPGGTVQLIAAGQFSDGSSHDVTRQVTWTSSQPQVATVGSGGLVTGLAGGSAEIAAASGSNRATATIVVVAVPVRLQISPAAPAVAKGARVQLTADIVLSDGSTQHVSPTWTSTDEVRVSVTADGLATGLTVGSATVTAQAHGLSAEVTVTVGPAALIALRINPVQPRILKGLTQPFTATATYTDGELDVSAAVDWESSDPTVATIDGAVAIGLGAGQTTITASLGGKSVSTLLVVAPPVVESIQVSPDFSVPLAVKTQITALAIYTDHTATDVTGVAEWTSSNASVASVDDPGHRGLVVPHSTGQTTITARFNEKSASLLVTVTPPVLDRIDVTPANPSVVVRDTRQLTATGVLTDGSQVDLTAAVEWKSSNEAAAAVDGSGLLITLDLGSSTITAKTGGITGSTDVQVTPEGSAWTLRSFGSVLHGVGTSDTELIAAGEAGVIVGSTDGVTWTTRKAAGAVFPDDVGLYVPLWTGSRWLALGGFNYDSTDGVHWQNDGSFGDWIYAATFARTQAVAVGTRGLSAILDADNFFLYPLAMGEGTTLRGVAWSGTTFVAVGDGGVAFTSDDAIHWTAVDSKTTQSLKAVVWSGTQFLAVGGDVTVNSPDGTEWTAVPTNDASNDLEAVTWTGTQFVAVGFAGRVLTSPDGAAWTRRDTGTTLTLYGVIWTGRQLVAVGDRAILTSPDGIDWTARSGATVDQISAAVWTGTQFVGAGDRGAIITSPDGLDWTLRDSGTDESFLEIATGDGKIVAVGTGGIDTSDDGVAWTHQNLGTEYLYGVAWSGSVWTTVGASGVVYTSTDAVSWTPQTSGTSEYLLKLAWTGTRFIAVGTAGIVLTSPDGASWTRQSSGTTVELWSLIWTGTQLVAGGRGGTIVTSPDGVTWTVRDTGSNLTFFGLGWSGRELVAVGQAGAVLTSPDGVNWTARNSSTADYLLAVAWSGERFVALGGNGTIVTSP